jgi:hypothetical protein
MSNTEVQMMISQHEKRADGIYYKIDNIFKHERDVDSNHLVQYWKKKYFEAEKELMYGDIKPWDESFEE